jgi:tetratricopeptide (TPR) repeat protein
MPALDGVRWTDLGLLSRSDGVRLLHAVAATDADADAGCDAAAEIVDLCDRLPLAIRIAGARILGRPHWTLDRLAAALRDERGRLDELTIGDLAVRGSLRLSYRALEDDAARLFRRLGLLDEGDVNSWVAATLLDVPVDTAERLVDRLVDAQLLLVSAPGPGRHLRYRQHDLVRLYARERVDAEEPPAERAAALVRTWTALADLATEADRRSPLRILTAVSTATGSPPSTDPWAETLLTDPAAWLDAERTLLVSAARATASARAGALAWRIPAASLVEFQTRGLFHDWRDTHRRGLRAAVGDAVGRAVMHRNLAQLEVFGGGGDWRRGIAHAGTALALFRRTGRRHGEVDALFLVSAAHLRLGDLDRALPPAEEGLRLARGTGDRRAEANLLHQVGWIHRMNGRIDVALDHLERGLRLADDGGFTRLHIWLSLAVGIVRREQGDLEAAEHHLRGALAAARRARTDGDVGSILNHLAALQRRRDDPAGARRTAEEALRLSRAVGLAVNEADALLTLGEIQIDLGAGGRARDLLTAARDQLAGLGSAYGQARAWKALGVAEQLDGRPDAARAARHEARRLFADVGSAAEVRALDALLEE